MIAEPLTRFMCSPLTDGAAAMLVMSSERTEEAGGHAVRIASTAIRSGHPVRGAAAHVITQHCETSIRGGGIGS
jgi:acetyl-CoA acetyltransferase